MAKLVLAAGVPHPPRLVFEMQQSPGKVKGEALMKQVREQVDKAEPDLIIEVDSDHFVNFFYNNLPSFCIGMAEEAQGPQEDWCPMPRYTVRGHVPLAKALFKYGVHDKFDLAAAHELRPNAVHLRAREHRRVCMFQDGARREGIAENAVRKNPARHDEENC